MIGPEVARRAGAGHHTLRADQTHWIGSASVTTPAGAHSFGPDNATLTARTGRSGPAAKAGHDLAMEVTAWAATLRVGEGASETSIELTADASSLRVRDAAGGLQALGDDDEARILATIDDDVLRRQPITFRSTAVRTAASGRAMTVQGELTLAGQTRAISFDLVVGDDGRLTGSAIVRQTHWGIKPYSALFGALKVADDVEVTIDAALDPPRR